MRKLSIMIAAMLVLAQQATAKTVYVVGQRDFIANEDHGNSEAFLNTYADAINNAISATEETRFVMGAAAGVDQMAARYIAANYADKPVSVQMFPVVTADGGDNVEQVKTMYADVRDAVSIDGQSFSSFGKRDQALFEMTTTNGKHNDDPQVIAFLRGKYAFKSTTCMAIVAQAVRQYQSQYPHLFQQLDQPLLTYLNHNVRNLLPREPDLDVDAYVGMFVGQLRLALSNVVQSEWELKRVQAYVLVHVIQSIYNRDADGLEMRKKLHQYLTRLMRS